MATPSDERLHRFDAAIVAIWAGLSLFCRRLLGPFPIAPDPQTAAIAVIGLGPGKLIWVPLVFYAGILPLAILLFHHIYAARCPRWMRLGSAAGGLGFALFAVGLSLNVVEATTAGAYMAGLPGSPDAGNMERFGLLWQVDQILAVVVTALLAGWMAAVSFAGRIAGFAAWPRWFSAGGVAAAVVTIGAGAWGVISQGGLAALDGGDALILVHLWIGLVSTLIWQQYVTRRTPA